MISYHSVKSLNTTVSNKRYYHSCKVTSWDKAENETSSCWRREFSNGMLIKNISHLCFGCLYKESSFCIYFVGIGNQNAEGGAGMEQHCNQSLWLRVWGKNDSPSYEIQT